MRLMMSVWLIVTGLAVSPYCVAQVQPASRSIVNYRLTGFSVPQIEGITAYEFEVYELLITDTGSSIDIPVLKRKTDEARMVATLPHWSTTYTWKVNYYVGDDITKTSPVYRFATGYSTYTDTQKYKLDIISNTYPDKELLIFIDETKALYNLEGMPVWYLPEINGINDEHAAVRDLKMTPYGTITFLCKQQAYEIDYNGNVLWMAPSDGTVSGDTTENYHHDFSRLKNGNYMVCGASHVDRKLPDSLALKIDQKAPGRVTNKFTKGRNGNILISVLSGTIIEYTPEGKVAWSWNSGEHFTDEDLFSRLSNNNFSTQTHLNSIYFNPDESAIYASFRNINRVVKISYPSGKILASYGDSYMISEKIHGTGLFYGQHSSRINNEGDLYLYNNNNALTAINDTIYTKTSSIIILKEPVKQDDTVQKIWEFGCDIDTLTSGFSPGGGSVTQLSSGAYLACVSCTGRQFIVNSKKNILWNAILKHYLPDSGWIPTTAGYRNNAINSTDDLKQLIFAH